MATDIIGTIVIDPEALEAMKGRGGDWFCYQNHDLSSPTLGHARFIKCGSGCTLTTPPKKHPDMHDCIGWRYLLVGKVNLDDGEVKPIRSGGIYRVCVPKNKYRRTRSYTTASLCDRCAEKPVNSVLSWERWDSCEPRDCEHCGAYIF